MIDARSTERLVRLVETPRDAVADVLADFPDRMAAHERIIGETNDLQSANFLARGARAAKSIGRISAPVTDMPPVMVQSSGESAIRRGVPGTSRSAPYLVVLHGRSQQGRDPQRLGDVWSPG